MSLPTTPMWSLAHIGLKFPGATVVAGAIFLALAEDTKPMVAITFDDGRESTYIHALPIMNERDIVGTTYITTDFLNHSGHISEDQLKEFVVAGWEIGAHGSDHSDFVTLTPKQLLPNLNDPAKILEEISNQEVFSVASPYGSYNDEVIAEIEKIYSSHVTAVNGWSLTEGLNTIENFDPYRVKRIDITSDVSVEQVCNRVATLPEDSLYVILFHNITDEPGKYNTNIETFQSIVDCIAEADVSVVRVSDGVEAMRLK